MEMITACGATPTIPSGAPGGGGGTSGSSAWSLVGSPGPLDGTSGGGGGGAAGTVWVIVTGEGGGGGAGGGGGPAGGGKVRAPGIGAGIGVPCGAAPITDATMVPCASQSVSPSPPMM